MPEQPVAQQTQDRADHPDQALFRLERFPDGFQAGVVDDPGSLDPGIVDSRLLGTSPERGPRPFEIRRRERRLLYQTAHPCSSAGPVGRSPCR